MAPVLEENQLVRTKKTVLEGELLIWRTKNQARDQDIDSPTQGFNLIQMSPNWFLGNCTLEPRLKWALVYRLQTPIQKGIVSHHVPN